MTIKEHLATQLAVDWKKESLLMKLAEDMSYIDEKVQVNKLEPFVDNLLDIDTNSESEYVCICYSQPEFITDTDTVNPVVVKKNDLYEKEILYNFDSEETLMNTDNYVSVYGIEMMNWKDLLSATLSDISVAECGIETCLVSIIHAMFFFGITKEDQEKKTLEIETELKDTIDQLESGTMKTYSLEEVFDDLREEYGFEKKEKTEQQKFSWKADMYVGIWNRNRCLEYEKERIKKGRE